MMEIRHCKKLVGNNGERGRGVGEKGRGMG